MLCREDIPKGPTAGTQVVTDKDADKFRDKVVIPVIPDL